MHKIASVLVVRLSAIGDLVLVAPITAQLASEGYRVSLLCKDAYRAVASCLPGVHEVLSWEKDRARITARTLTFEHVIDLQGTLKSKRWCGQLKVPVHTYQKPYVRRALLLATKHMSFALTPVVHRYAAAAAPLFAGALRSDAPDYRLRLPEVELELPQQPYVALVLGGSYAGKRLDFQAWRQIMDGLSVFQMPLALIGGPEEAGMGESLEQPLGSGAKNYCGTTTVIEGFKVIENAALVISGDTGFMHAAANFNRPLISFWGATNPALGFAPWPVYDKQRTVVTRSVMSPISKHGKVPWFLPNPMRKLPLDEVISAAASILQDKTMP
jgi:ADP-heptose:LPS heptosyltransferase